jgi:hypothetical protein
MTRFAIAAGGVGVAALMLAACTPPYPHHEGGALRSITSLDCPDSQGDLMRQSAASDGKSCVYGDDAGDTVTLQLVELSGQDAKTALAPIEAQLRSEMPAVSGAKASATSGATAAGGSANNDRVDIDLPGIHIHASGNDHAGNNHATIEAGGGGANKSSAVTDDDGNVTVSSNKPGVTADAGDDGAEIQVDEPGSGVRRSFIVASDTPGPHGYRMVGYEARGPSGGPLVVASIKAKSDDHDRLTHDIRRLLRRNVGG